MTPEEFVSALQTHRTSAIVRAESAALAHGAMNAAIRGGVRIVEFTMTTPGALELVAEFAARKGLDVVDGLDTPIVGAGTVLTPEQARDAVHAGARFLVSPVADPTVIRAAAELGVAMIPGVHTPTEMMMAHDAGAPLLKLFPAPAGGPEYLRSALAPLPFLKVVPTNGVDESNIAKWLDAGAWGVGLVGPLFRTEDVTSENWAAIEARAARMRAAAMAVDR
jgi:2-dehydro-3-deoxyphosphogluconate aldolase/(4S)-4-hydroxy-2-oxoglutarate aldolase